MKTIWSVLLLAGMLGTGCIAKLDEPTPQPPVPPAQVLVEPTLSGFSLPDHKVGDADFMITPPASNSSGTFSYVSNNEKVAQVVGNVISIKNVGTAIITATQAANGKFTSGSISAVIEVSAKDNVTGDLHTPKHLKGYQYQLLAPVSVNPSKFTFTSSDPLVAKASNDTLTIVGIGQATITASQPAFGGSAAYSETMVVTVTVAPITAPVRDADNNIYTYASVGKQVWLMENLSTTKYTDGRDIPLNNDNTLTGWGALTNGAYTIYDHDPQNKAFFGCLYNWNAAVDTKGIAPQGWHILTVDEAEAFIKNGGGHSVAAAQLRNAARDAQELAALKAGWFNNNDQVGHFSFKEVNLSGAFWLDIEAHTDGAWAGFLQGDSFSTGGADKNNGLAIRCLQNYIITFR